MLNKKIRILQKKADKYNDLEEYKLFDKVLEEIFKIAERKKEMKKEEAFKKEIIYCNKLLKQKNKKIFNKDMHTIAKERIIKAKLKRIV